MNKETINSIIDKLNAGCMALAQQANNQGAIALRNEILYNLLSICKENNLFDYVCEQIILKSPIITPVLLDIIRERYPESLERVQKLSILA